MTQTLNSSCDRTNVKFLYSYNGQILPRRSDGRLRYVGGYTRVLSVDRSISFTELMVKFGELCGASMSLKCKLPDEDLDVLVSIKSDEELRYVIGEYDRAAALAHQEIKIRAVLFPITSDKKVSPPCTPMSFADFAAPKFQPSRFSAVKNYQPQPYMAAYQCCSLPSTCYRGGAHKEAVRTFCCRREGPRHLYHAIPYSNYLH